MLFYAVLYCSVVMHRCFINYNSVVLFYYVGLQKDLNVDEIDTSTTSRHQPSYCHLKRNTQHSISRSYYLYHSPLQHNSDPNTDTAPYPISYNRHTQTFKLVNITRIYSS